ncbi:hypothetical protein [Polymorphobacter megasporae]|uniref:hypothetical protein n=1 Tax=Glacieibacterium megasporae TaxID=2835787 RepID=UPI001C1DED08|nr:hypothetical protein [Polymorphobacter megasporae]UAJ11532.1 hypothetical protein KTC28_07635 [Polymorphobacter megasporae]
MKHASIIEQRRRREPDFDLPPQFAGVDDRRLGGRIIASWTEGCGRRRLPAAGEFRAALDAEWLPNLVWLDSGTVRNAGASVASTFGVTPGPLPVQSPFGRALALAAHRSERDAMPARLEGGFARSPGGPVTLLTRGVVLPLDPGEDDATACAVITWTESLPTFDSDRLRHELWLSLTSRADGAMR